MVINHLLNVMILQVGGGFRDFFFLALPREMIQID